MEYESSQPQPPPSGYQAPDSTQQQYPSPPQPGTVPTAQHFSTNIAPPQYAAVVPQYQQSENQPLLENQKDMPVVMIHNVQCPENHLLLAILATLFCFWPTGIIAIIFSLKVNQRFNNGDLLGAEHSARQAKQWIKISIIVGICVIALFTISSIMSVISRLILFDNGNSY